MITKHNQKYSSCSLALVSPSNACRTDEQQTLEIFKKKEREKKKILEVCNKFIYFKLAFFFSKLIISNVTYLELTCKQMMNVNLDHEV